MSIVLGIDCGTQSTKVLVYDSAKRKVIASGQAPHPLISDSGGRREQKSEWWIRALKKALSNVPRATRLKITAIGISGQQHGFVPVGDDGRVLYNVKLWNDTSTAPECEEITRSFGGNQRLLSEVGNLILPGYTISKILWLKKHKPGVYREMAAVLLPHDYLNYYLTGSQTMECGDASGTGFLNIRERKWSDELIGTLNNGIGDLKACLPRIIQSHEAAGFVSDKAAKEFGLTPGTLVAAGGGDNMMGAIGTGTNTDGSLTVSLGTSGTLYGYSDKPIIDPQGSLASFCSSSGGWLPLLCTMNCTVATELTRGLLSLDLRKMERIASKAKPGSDGVLMLPFFNGERTPNLPNGRGCIVGLNPANYTQANLLRSSMESGVFGLKLGLESFQRLGFEAKEVKLIGGGSKSGLWRQMAADIFDLPVICPEEEEAAAFGGCLQSLWAYSHHKGAKTRLNDVLTKHVKFSKEKKHRPNTARARAYSGIYETYKSYVAAVSPLFK